jgi:hypothetical protein
MDAITGLATPWDPRPNGSVTALAVGPGRIYAGGSFTMAGGTPRNFLAALDLGSGKATAWNPGANGTVSALAAKGGIVYAAGSFSQVGGQPRNHLASLDALTGAPTSWDPEPDGEVDALAVGDSTLYTAGAFANIGAVARNRIAAFDARTGLLTPWDPNAGDCVPIPYCCDETCVDTCYSQQCPFVVSLAVSGSMVYAGGSFDYIGGQPRHDLAALDAGTGQATPWNPSPSGVVSTILVSDSAVYVGGAFTSIGGKPRSGIAALRASDGLASPWNPAPAGGPVLALALGASNDVYAGGVFQGFGNSRRPYLAQIDAAGSLTDWNPLAASGPNALVLDGPVIYAAGTFSSIGDLPHAGLAAIQRGLLSVPSSDNGAPFFWARLSPNPTHGPIDIDFTLAAATDVRLDVFDLQGRRVAQLTNGNRPAGSHHVRWTGRIAGGMAPPGVYLIRFQASKRSQTRRVVVIR